MTYVQIAAGWAIAYIVVPLFIGLIAETETCEFWAGFRFGLLAMVITNVIVALAFIANGWTLWL
jgi:hypothetical protein